MHLVEQRATVPQPLDVVGDHGNHRCGVRRAARGLDPTIAAVLGAPRELDPTAARTQTGPQPARASPVAGPHEP
jgi:hypothetical protein